MSHFLTLLKVLIDKHYNKLDWSALSANPNAIELLGKNFASYFCFDRLCTGLRFARRYHRKAPDALAAQIGRN